VSDDSGIDLTGALRVGKTNDTSELIVNGVRFEIARLYETWSAPLAAIYP
jgi:hypothetical protein